MIVTPEDRSLRIVTQSDHAHLAGEIAALWRSDALPENPRRADIVFAAREHDNGWRETDSAPWVDPTTGRPHDFTDLPDGPRIELWRRGVERYAGRRPYAALLICRHAEELLGDRRGEEPWDEGLFERLDELVEDLSEETGASRDQVETDYRFVALADRVSLALSARWSEPFAVCDHHGRVDGDTVLFYPFPLAGATSFTLRCRSIPDRRYADPVDLIGALAGARWTEQTVRLAPAGPAFPATAEGA